MCNLLVMQSLKHVAEIVVGVLVLCVFVYLKWKDIEYFYSRDDLLDRSKMQTLFNTERDRMRRP